MAGEGLFQTTYEGAYKAKSAFGDALQVIAEEIAKRKRLEREYQLKSQAERPALLATLAAKGLLPATNLPKEPSTIEDYRRLAQGAGQDLTADTPDTARRLIEASGIPIPKRPQTFKLGELGEFYQEKGIGTGRNIADVSDLTSEQQLQGRALARKIYGVRGAEYGLPAVYEEMRKGKSIDEIEDNLRYAGQSPEFGGAIRNAAQQIMAGKTLDIKQSTFDDLDDLRGKPEEQKSYLRRIAINQAPVEIQNRITGKERTIELLDEIKGDLDILEKNGIDTNILSGTYEEVQGKLGMVANPQLRQIITKINTAIYNYRKDMSGVAFPDKETRDYKRIFPGGGKTKELNMATIKGLKDIFSGDVKYFYKRAMGSDNYKALFEESKAQSQSGLTIGTIKKGYKYLGGNPADKNNWEKQ